MFSFLIIVLKVHETINELECMIKKLKIIFHILCPNFQESFDRFKYSNYVSFQIGKSKKGCTI
jgi:hypothetical protein